MRYLFLIAALVLGGAPALAGGGDKLLYRCSNIQIIVNFHRDKMELIVDEIEYKLQRTISAGGARYVSDGIELWNVGNKIQLTFFGEVLPECLPQESALNGEWIVERIVSDDASGASVRFEDGIVSGDTGCNRFRSEIAFKAAEIQVGPVSLTRQLCPQQKMEQESRFLSGLEKIRQFSFAEPARAILSAGDGTELFQLKRK